MTADLMLRDIPPQINQLEDINRILKHMSDNGGSDLFIRAGMPPIANIYGRKVRLMPRILNAKEVEGILALLAGSSAPSLINSAKPVNDAHEFIHADGGPGQIAKTRYRYRLNAIGCLVKARDAMTITMRSIPTTPPRPADIGMEEEILQQFRTSDQGLILVCGATGNGKSTLLAAAIRDQLENPEGNRNIVTVEEPIEFVYDDIDMPSSLVTQIPVGRKIKSFHEGVINAMRMAPTDILVGESRDYETVSAAVEGSVTGHVVYSTVHSNSISETFQRLVAVYPEQLQPAARLDIVQAAKMLVVQRLVASVDGKRQALREILVLDQQIKESILGSNNLAAAAMQAVAQHGQPMVEDARKKLEDGRISHDTYHRIEANYASMKSRMGS